MTATPAVRRAGGPIGHDRAIVARVLLLSVALVALAFLAFGLRQAEDERRARPLVAPERAVEPAQAARARRLLRRAGRDYPGTEPEILRAILEVNRGRPRAALPHLREALRREPDNIEAWAWLANAAEDVGDRGLLARAHARIRALRPRVNDG